MDFCKNCKNSYDIKKNTFVCNNCGYTTDIKPGAMIYSKMYEQESSTLFLEDYDNICDDHTLPRTRDYLCPNTKCPTNSKKDSEQREAVFKRLGKTYRLVYMCCVCKEHWFINPE